MARDSGRKNNGCTVGFLEGILHGFNIIFLITGLGALGVAVWTVTDKYKYVELLTTVTYPVITYFLLAVGALVLIISILGCCAICNQNRLCLVIYIFFLLFIFLVEAMVGILAYVYEEQVQNEIQLNLNNTFLTGYRIDPEKTAAIDFLQEKFSCCGAGTFEDWRYGLWMKHNLAENNIVPDSCCKTVTMHCGKRDHPSNINYAGCMDKMAEHLKQHLLVLSAVGLGICALQILGILLSCRLYFKLKDIDIV